MPDDNGENNETKETNETNEAEKLTTDTDTDADTSENRDSPQQGRRDIGGYVPTN